MLLPPIHIPQAPLPLYSHCYSDPTRLVSHGHAWPPAGRPAPLGSAPRILPNLLQMDSDTDPAMMLIWRSDKQIDSLQGFKG